MEPNGEYFFHSIESDSTDPGCECVVHMEEEGLKHSICKGDFNMAACPSLSLTDETRTNHIQSCTSWQKQRSCVVFKVWLNPPPPLHMFWPLLPMTMNLGYWAEIPTPSADLKNQEEVFFHETPSDVTRWWAVPPSGSGCSTGGSWGGRFWCGRRCRWSCPLTGPYTPHT